MRAEWEIERKFVVTFLPEGLLDTRQPVKVRQGYISSDGERQVRILDEGGNYTMIISQGLDINVRIPEWQSAPSNSNNSGR